MRVFDVREYGAKGDGVTNDATAIQAAVSACHDAGGGRVVVAGGTFLTGSLRLDSGVDLHIEAEAVLRCSGRWDDITCRFATSALTSGVMEDAGPDAGVFILAEDAVGVSISGAGTIDGAGSAYAVTEHDGMFEMRLERPFLVCFIGCTGVEVRDVHLVDAALWTVRLSGCEDVAIDSVTIENDMRVPNADGIDVDHSRRVRVTDCSITCPDDGISLKATPDFAAYGDCADILVQDCVIQSLSSALVVGVEAVSPIHDVLFDSCIVRASNRGLSVNVGDVGPVENVVFSHITVETGYVDGRWWGSGEPIYVSNLPWHDRAGVVRDVRFVDVTARGENGVVILGHPDGLLDGVVLQGVRVELTGTAAGRLDRRPWSGGPEVIDCPRTAVRIERAGGVTLHDVTMGAPPGEPVHVSVTADPGDAVALWHPLYDHSQGLAPVWIPRPPVEPMRSAPVWQLVSATDRGLVTVALGAAVGHVDVRAGIVEETRQFELDLVVAPGESDVDLRVDTSDRHFGEHLADVAAWWERQLGAEAIPVPPVAYLPVWGTWYERHQAIDAATVERWTTDAAAAGFASIIVDDGWQTTDHSRGYRACGDWVPAPSKFPDFAAHVRRVREHLSYILWIAPGLIGRHTAAWERFADRLLAWEDGLDAGILDPRFPEVRTYLAEVCRRTVADWGVDGLKIDFVDSFAGHPSPVRDGMDIPDVGAAVEALLGRIAEAVREVKPEAIVEFRQHYTGPRMWQYANALRAGDCPMDAAENRVRTVDLRLISGHRPVHADPIVWAAAAGPADIARQFINALFAVPQVSVALDTLSPEQAATVRFWLRVFDDLMDVRLHKDIRPSRPDLRYPLVTALGDGVQVTGVYADVVAPVSAPRVVLANSTPSAWLTVRGVGDYRATAHHPTGDPAGESMLCLTPEEPCEEGIGLVRVPPGGLVVLDRLEEGA